APPTPRRPRPGRSARSLPPRSRRMPSTARTRRSRRPSRSRSSSMRSRSIRADDVIDTRAIHDTYPAALGARQRVVAGVAIALCFGIPFVLSVVLVATSGDPALLIFPLPFLGALWAMQGLAPSGFTLEERGIRLERRWLSRRLPYAAILAVDRRPRRIGGLLALGWNSVFGSRGWRWNPWTGWHY